MVSFAGSSAWDERYDSIPPAPILWITGLLDTVCVPLQCSNWRQMLHVPEDSMFAFRLPSLRESMPQKLSYNEFLLLQQQQEGSSYNNYPPAWSLRSLHQFAFETNSTVLGDLTRPTSLIVLFALLVVFRAIKHTLLMRYFTSLGRRVEHARQKKNGSDDTAAAAVREKGVGVNNTNQQEERIIKFGEYCFRLVFHTLISIGGYWYFKDKPWWAFEGLKYTGGSHYFEDPYHQPMEPGTCVYFFIQAAYNVDAFLSLLERSVVVHFQLPVTTTTTNTQSSTLLIVRSPIFFQWAKSVRGDFPEMMAHHLVTIGLIFAGSYLHLTRIGSLFFWVHDFSDVWVDLSKLANFLKWKRTTTVCFAVMTFMWFVLRLIELPYVLIYHGHIHAPMICEADPQGGLCPNFFCYRAFLYIGVFALLLLHALWFGMFLRMLLTWVVSSKNKDHHHHQHMPSNNGKQANNKKQN